MLEVVVFIGGIVADASSNNHRCLTLSTSEAEYIGIGERAKSGLYTRVVLSFVQPQLSVVCLRLFKDNERANALAENPLCSARSKHVDFFMRFLRELVKSGDFEMCSASPYLQHADFVTKSSTAVPFDKD